MTKKHLIALAALASELRAEYNDNIPAHILETRLSALCASFNPAFDAGRFIAACAKKN